MTHFDASTAESRRTLFAEAVRAHRERASAYLTVEVDDDVREAWDLGVPWVQFAEDTVNVDCSDDEHDRLLDLLDEFPAFTVAELADPEDAPGRNVRIQTRADVERIAEFIDVLLETVFDLPGDYRAWVVEV